MKERAVRINATWNEHGLPKYVEGRVYPLDEETERLVTVYTCAEFVEVDRTVERLQLAILNARAAETLLVQAEVGHAQAAETAKTAQTAVQGALVDLSKEGEDKPELVDLVRNLLDARQALAVANETARAAAASAAEPADDAGNILAAEEVAKRKAISEKAAAEASTIQAKATALEQSAAALGDKVEIDAIAMAIEITRA